MQIYDKNWEDIKNIIDGNDFYYDYEDLGDYRDILVYRSLFYYYCHKMVINPDHPDFKQAEYEDFENNYKQYAGDWKYYLRSWTFEDLVIDYENVRDFQFKNWSDETVRAILYNGCACVTGATDGDSLTFQVVDKDGIIAPAGTVLNEFVNLEMNEGENMIDVTPPPRTDGTPSKSKIFEFLYVRLIYDSVAISGDPAKVKVKLCYEWL